MNYNVLGTGYTVKIISNDERDDFPDMTADMDGYCNYYTKEIVVVRDDSDMQGYEEYVNQVVRHELVHAYLYESGLHEYSTDETLVDWMAIQVPKMAETFSGKSKKRKGYLSFRQRINRRALRLTTQYSKGGEVVKFHLKPTENR